MDFFSQYYVHLRISCGHVSNILVSVKEILPHTWDESNTLQKEVLKSTLMTSYLESYELL